MASDEDEDDEMDLEKAIDLGSKGKLGADGKTETYMDYPFN